MRKVLIVDDQSSFRLLVSSILSQFPVEILQACNGREALQLVEEYSPDIVITDIFMPEMDGFELIKHLRDMATSPYIISMTGGDSKDLTARGNYLECAEMLGATYCIDKHMIPSKLSPLIISCLKD